MRRREAGADPLVDQDLEILLDRRRGKTLNENVVRTDGDVAEVRAARPESIHTEYRPVRIELVLRFTSVPRISDPEDFALESRDSIHDFQRIGSKNDRSPSRRAGAGHAVIHGMNRLLWPVRAPRGLDLTRKLQWTVRS